MYLSSEFQDRESIIRALRDLRANGVGPDDLDVFSDEPLELPRHALERRTHMSVAVVTGAITSCLLVIGFVYFTQHNYPIITGGMPIFSFWATGVVFYELTMFGAIVTTVFWFLRESGLLRRSGRPPAPLFEPGLICLRVHCDPDQEDGVRRLLETAGASNFRTWGDAS
jgi:hypothetical protein